MVMQQEPQQSQKMLYEYTTPLGGRRTDVVGGYIPAIEDLQKYEKLNPVDFEICRRYLRVESQNR